MADIFNGTLETETSAFTTQFTGKTEDGSNALSITTASGEYHTGSKGAKIVFDGTNANAYATKSFSDQTEIYARVMFKIPTGFEMSDNYQSLGLIELTDGAQGLVRVETLTYPSTDFRFYVYYWDGDSWENLHYTGNLSNDTWYRIELHWKAGSGSDGGVGFKLDGGTLQSSYTHNLTAYAADTVNCGGLEKYASHEPLSSVEIFWDECALDSTGWLGAPTEPGTDIDLTLGQMSMSPLGWTVDADIDTNVDLTLGQITITPLNWQVGGNVYYVRADGTASDKESATSDSAASTSMSVSTHNSETFSPGDRIRISGLGGVYRTQLVPPSSGSSSADIVYEGTSSPDMRGSELVTGWTTYSGNIWEATLSAGDTPTQVFIDGAFGDRKSSIGELTDDGDWYWTGNTLYLYDSVQDPDNYSSPGIEAATISQAILFPGRTYVTFDGLTIKQTKWQGLASYVASSYITIRNCNFQYCWQHSIYPGVQSYTNPVTGWLIEDNEISYGMETGIYVGVHAVDTVIRRNKIWNIDRATYGQPGTSTWTAGIKHWGDDSWGTGIQIYENEIYDCGPVTGGSGTDHGNGIWMDRSIGTSGSHNLIYRNYVHDCSNNGIFVEVSLYTDVWANLIVDCASIDWTGGIYVNANSSAPCHYNRTYNNTVIGGHSCYIFRGDDGAGLTFTYNELVNNIGYGGTWAIVHLANGGDNDGTNGENNVIANNCFGAEASNFLGHNWGRYSTYDSYETAIGFALNGIEQNPVLNDVGSDEYWLGTASPCKDAGTGLGSPFDIALDPASTWPDGVVTADQDDYGTNWDLGAYVKTASLDATMTLGELELAALNFDIQADVDINVGMTLGQLELEGLTWNVQADVDTNIDVALGQFEITAYAMTLQADVDSPVDMTLGQFELAGLKFDMTADLTIDLSMPGFELQGHVFDIESTPQFVNVPMELAQFEIQGYPFEVFGGANVDIDMSLAQLELTGYNWTVKTTIQYGPGQLEFQPFLWGVQKTLPDDGGTGRRAKWLLLLRHKRRR